MTNDNSDSGFGNVVYTGGHDASVRAVIAGDIDAAAVSDSQVQRMTAAEEEGMEDIVLVPETLPKRISWSIFRSDIDIRYASILGVVGAGGIGWELSRAARMGDFQSAITVTLVIFAVVWAIEQISTGLGRMID